MVRLTKITAGYYTYKIRNTTFEIYRNDERDSSWYGEWIIKNPSDVYGYSDPIPSLKRCREALMDMEANPDLYQIK